MDLLELLHYAVMAAVLVVCFWILFMRNKP